MKTSFGRQFAITAGLVLVCFLILGLGFLSLLYNYLVDEKEQSLSTNAKAVAALAVAYGSTGELEQNMDFRISLTFAAQISEADALLCDEDGTVVLCSGNTVASAQEGKIVSKNFLQNVPTDGKCYCTKGYLNGIYAEKRYIVAMPVVSDVTGQTLGTVIVSQNADEITGLLRQMYKIFLISAILALVLAMFACTFLSKQQSRPLRDLANAARRFGRGELDTRVLSSSNSTEEVNDLVTAFNNMADSLEQSDRRRSEFVANISHELKTPMTTIAGFMDGMLDGTIPPERHRQYMQAVSDEVRRLSRLVRSMLDVSRLQAQGVSEAKKTRFAVNEIIGRTLLTFEQKINAKSLQVEVNLPDRDVMALADPDAITQVVYNLIDNAVKFCNPGGTLRLGLTTGGGKARVSVANTGDTIPPEELRLIFDRFHKTDKSRSQDKDGVGLGLYIVRTIICSHNEDITVTSKDGLTTFCFTLTLAK